LYLGVIQKIPTENKENKTKFQHLLDGVYISNENDIMNRRNIILTGTLFAASFFAAGALKAENTENVFKNPPHDAKPFTWWHWVGGNISKEGIVKDLDAMKASGLGGIQLFNVSPTCLDAGPVTYGSEEWWGLLKFAAEEMRIRKFDFTMANCAGWATSAGPHITPEYAMQQLVWTEKTVDAAAPQKVILEKFDKSVHKHVNLIPSVTMSQGVDLPQKDEWQRKFYKDIIVFAFPTPKDELEGKPHRLDGWEIKSGNKAAKYAEASYDTRQAPNPIKADEILDLTSKMSADGTLDWTPPAGSGSWTIVRMGHIITGKPNHPAPVGGRGLEVDKLSREAAEFHFNKGILPIIEMLNGDGKKRLDTILVDSYEAKTQNWSPVLPQEFKRLRGYDLLKYAPAFTGRVVNSADFTERFLWDFRRTVADLMIENNYSVLADLCHKHGVRFAAEGYGRPSYLDEIETSLTSDFPMAEFWVGAYAGSNFWTSKEAASIADLRRIPYVGAESFTAGADFNVHAGDLKMQGDYYETFGINRFIYHTYAHQPFREDLYPAVTLYIWGSHMHRKNPWWSVQMPLWNAYLNRTQALLQRGKLVADAAFYMDEDAQVEPGYRNPDMPQNPVAKRAFDNRKNPQMEFDTELSDGYDFHLMARTFLSELSVENGRLHHPSGYDYEILAVREKDGMRLNILKHIEKLVSEGANVSMLKPARTPGLENYPAADAELKALADKMWAGKLEDGGYRKYGKGKIFEPGSNVAKLMQTLGVQKDFEYKAAAVADAFVRYTHRTAEDASYYFVTNQTKGVALDLECVFRISGFEPELWDAENGAISAAPAWQATPDGRTKLWIKLPQNGSVFVVFRKKLEGGALAAAGFAPNGAELLKEGGKLYIKAFANGDYALPLANGAQANVAVAGLEAPQDISGAWTLKFPKDTGSGNSIKLAKLKSWTELKDAADKYFSGAAAYEKTVEVAGNMLGANKGVLLDLGQVSAVAQVYINGKFAGTAWKTPYALDVTKFLKPGANAFKIVVTSTLANRMIGDEQFENPYLSKKTVNERIGRAPNTDEVPASAEKNYAERYVEIADWMYDANAPRPKTERKTFALYTPYTKSSKPYPSGLIGPAVLKPYIVEELK